MKISCFLCSTEYYADRADAPCPCCHIKQSVDSGGGDMKLYRGLYEASAQMREKRFNKARHMYLSLCREYPDSFYAFFGLAASKYGAVFVKENGEGNHSGSNNSNNNGSNSSNSINNNNNNGSRAEFEESYTAQCLCPAPEAFSEQPAFKKACMLASERDATTREALGRLAQMIDRDRVQILERAALIPSYDIFLTVKYDPETGGFDPTVGRLYFRLTEQGRRVFFAPEIIPKADEHHAAPFVYRALETCTQMLVYIGSTTDFANFRLRNEITRYSSMISAGLKEEDSIVVAYSGISQAEIPPQLAKYPSFELKGTPSEPSVQNGADKDTAGGAPGAENPGDGTSCNGAANGENSWKAGAADGGNCGNSGACGTAAVNYATAHGDDSDYDAITGTAASGGKNPNRDGTRAGNRDGAIDLGRFFVNAARKYVKSVADGVSDLKEKVKERKQSKQAEESEAAESENAEADKSTEVSEEAAEVAAAEADAEAADNQAATEAPETAETAEATETAEPSEIIPAVPSPDEWLHNADEHDPENPGESDNAPDKPENTGKSENSEVPEDLEKPEQAEESGDTEESGNAEENTDNNIENNIENTDSSTAVTAVTDAYDVTESAETTAVTEAAETAAAEAIETNEITEITEITENTEADKKTTAMEVTDIAEVTAITEGKETTEANEANEANEAADQDGSGAGDDAPTVVLLTTNREKDKDSKEKTGLKKLKKDKASEKKSKEKKAGDSQAKGNKAKVDKVKENKVKDDNDKAKENKATEKAGAGGRSSSKLINAIGAAIIVLIFTGAFLFVYLNGWLFAGTSGLEYEYADGGVAVSDYAGNATSVRIPKKYRGNTVVGIRCGAFSGKVVTGLTIADTVTEFEYGALSGIEGLVSLSMHAPSSGIEELSDRTSEDCVRALAAHLFGTESYNGAVQVTQKYAGGTMTCYIPATLTELKITGGNIENGAFSGISSLVSVIISDKVRIIEPYAFMNCTGLISAALGNGAICVGDYGFYGCHNLEKVSGGKNLYVIGKSAFEKCAALTGFAFPDRLVSIGAEAFGDCGSLAEISLPEGLSELGDYAFRNCSLLTDVYLPSGIGGKPAGIFYACTSLGTFSGGEGLSGFGEAFFYNCTRLRNVAIPKNAAFEEIGDYAFFGCTGILSLPAAGNIKVIGKYAYASSGIAGDLKIPSGVKSIGERSFAVCPGITSVDITSATEVGPGAFSACENLKSVSFDTLSVPEECFSYCGTLENVTLASAGDITLGKSAFAACVSLTEFDFISRITKLEEMALAGCTGFTALEFSSLTEIGNNAFSGCTKLALLTLPDTLLRIGSMAFYNCGSLMALTIPASVEYIDEYCFAEWSASQVITIYGKNYLNWNKYWDFKNGAKLVFPDYNN